MSSVDSPNRKPNIAARPLSISALGTHPNVPDSAAAALAAAAFSTRLKRRLLSLTMTTVDEWRAAGAATTAGRAVVVKALARALTAAGRAAARVGATKAMMFERGGWGEEEVEDGAEVSGGREGDGEGGNSRWEGEGEVRGQCGSGD